METFAAQTASPAPASAPENSGFDERGHVMLVDDQPANLKLLEEMLRKRGYRVRSFSRGRHALAAAGRNPPDLILLDVNMPEMNGYEVCRQLKADPKLQEIPVIFLSALNEVGDKLQAFRSGAVDYISKPFQFDEVQARVEAHDQLHRLRQTLRRQNGHLESLVAERTRQLLSAHARLKALDEAKTEFLQLVSHELRTPLNGLMGIGELLLAESGGQTELRDLFEQSCRRILSMIEDAAIILRIDLDKEFGCGRVLLASALEPAIANAEAFGRPRGVAIERPQSISVIVCGAKDLLIRALESLLGAAVRLADAGSTVAIRCAESGGGVELAIESTGRTIPPRLIPRFFDLLAIGEPFSPDGDLGLGPALACRILRLCDGSAAVENLAGGIRFKASLRSGSFEEMTSRC